MHIEEQGISVIDLPQSYDDLAKNKDLQKIAENYVQNELILFLLKEITYFHKVIRNIDYLLMTDTELEKGNIIGIEGTIGVGYCWGDIPILSIEAPILQSPKKLALVCNRLYALKNEPSN